MLFVTQIDFLPMTSLLDGGDIRFCGQKQALIKYDIHLYHLYLSVFFVSAGVPYGEFPEILITKCRSRFYCTWFFSRVEDFESWRKGPSKSGEKCSRRMVHMYASLTLSKNKTTSNTSIASIQMELYVQKLWSRQTGRERWNQEM
jgi:hypothetical protein